MKTANIFRLTAVLALLCISVTAWADNRERDAQSVEFRDISSEVFLRNDMEVTTRMSRLVLENATAFEDYFVDASVAMGSYEMLSVDFLTEYVLGVVFKETDHETAITPVEVKINDDYIYFYYRVDKGEKRDFKLAPFCLVALPKPKQGNNFHVIFKQVN